MSEFKSILAPTAARCPAPLPEPRAHKCEFTLNIGLFFDGTDNNKGFHTDEGTNTNIARLWYAYRDRADLGYFSYYVSGVGTPFTEVDKTEAEAGGGPAGAGGEARIVYGLLQVVNSIHAFLNNQKERFRVQQLAALCSSTQVQSPHSDHPQEPSAEQRILAELGLNQGLVSAGDTSLPGATTPIEGARRKFFRSVDADLREQVASKRPRIAAIYLDVFGFSRGAAQARVFTTWLHDLLLIGGQLFGVPAYVRMLGLFDTVASVGVTDALGGYGHGSWATASNLRIHPEVRNCVHYVALHEFRTNFPSDGVGQDGRVPPNCQQLYCPGAHSDVGGGYGPGEQGKGVRMVRDFRYVHSQVWNAERDDSLKLSNLPLNQMLEAAKKACRRHPDVPWIEFDSAAGVAAGLRERFGLSSLEQVREAVQRYFSIAGVPQDLSASEALRQHGLLYLAWRYRVSEADGFEELASVQRARKLSPPDPQLPNYLAGQKIFKDQIRLLSAPAPVIDFNLTGDKDKRRAFHSQASAIFARMKTIRPHSSVGEFFDAWVHDSYAGFIGKFQEGVPSWARWTGNLTHIVAEAQRYVRWRGLYEGDDERVNLATVKDGRAQA